jgi:hypothetical protein
LKVNQIVRFRHDHPEDSVNQETRRQHAVDLRGFVHVQDPVTVYQIFLSEPVIDSSDKAIAHS